MDLTDFPAKDLKKLEATFVEMKKQSQDDPVYFFEQFLYTFDPKRAPFHLRFKPFPFQKRLIREVKNNITNRMLTGRLGAINNAYTSYAKQMEELQKDAGKKDGFSHTRINEAAELFKFKHQNLGKFDPATGRYENATSLQNPAYNYDINEQLDAAIKNTPAMKDYTVHKSRDGFTVINTITGKESKEGLQIVKNLYDRLLGDSKYKEDLS